MSSPASRMSRRTPARSYRSRISVVPSLEALSIAIDEVDAGMEVERDLRVDDVRLVPREQRHHEPHPTGSPSISSAASTTRSAARPSTLPTTCSTARRRAAASSAGCSSARSMPATTSSKRSAR